MGWQTTVKPSVEVKIAIQDLTGQFVALEEFAWKLLRIPFHPTLESTAMTRIMNKLIILLNGLSMVNGLGPGQISFLAKTVIACIWIGEQCMAMALENMRIGK